MAKMAGFRHKPAITKENRTSFFSHEWKANRIKMMGITTAGGISFMFWFLVCLAYMYGTQFHSGTRHHNLKILAVDYDGGVIGQSLRAAYSQMKGPGFLGLEFHTPDEFPTEYDMYHAVGKGKFWGAISASEGASDRLDAALQGGGAASEYNPAKALTYVWNQQYYTIHAMSVINPGLQQLAGATRIAYNKINGTQASRVFNQEDPAAAQALLNPIQATARNIKTASFGGGVLLGTVGSVTPVLAQFFFLLVLNGIMQKMLLFSKIHIRSTLIYRRIATLLYTLGAGLVQTGYTWAFREDWDVNGYQFVLTWMVLWLEMHVQLLIIDTIMTLVLMQVMPYVVLGWVFINISSTLSPLELQPRYYKWSVIMPAHNAYSLLVTVWTGGADNRVYRAMPILFAWLVAGLIGTTFAHVHACHVAYRSEREATPVLAKGMGAGLSSEGIAMSRQTTVSKKGAGSPNSSATTLDQREEQDDFVWHDARSTYSISVRKGKV